MIPSMLTLKVTVPRLTELTADEVHASLIKSLIEDGWRKFGGTPIVEVKLPRTRKPKQ